MARTKKTVNENTNEKYTTNPNAIDENGIYMGEPDAKGNKSNAQIEYEKLRKKLESMDDEKRSEYLDAIKNRYVYDPNKYHMRIRIIFINELLAMSPGNKDIYATFIADHAIDAMTREDQINTLGAQEVVNKGRSVFDRDVNGNIVWPSYRWLGYFKATMGALGRDEETETTKVTSYKSKNDMNMSFTAEAYPINLPAGGVIGHCDRTIPGDEFKKRPTSIKSSETAPIGTVTTFTVQTNIKNAGKKGGPAVGYLDALRECLDTGVNYGTGEWRGSGKKGNFVWEELDEEGHVIGGNTLKVIGATTENPAFKEIFWAYIKSREVGAADTLTL